MFVLMAVWANAFVNKYAIVSKIDANSEKPCSGTITLTGNKNSEGLVGYSSLTIYINDMVNYRWPLSDKKIVDETTVEMSYTYDHYRLQMQVLDDSTYIFALPLFYGSKQGVVKYKAVYRPEKFFSETSHDNRRAYVDEKKEKAKAAMSGLFGSGSNSSATRTPIGSGSGSSNGASWSLAGRGLSGSIPRPAYTSNGEGTVVVAIRVDEDGNVVSATKGAGTNTNDQSLINAAIEAAKKAKFTAGDGVAVGSITYVFRLN